MSALIRIKNCFSLLEGAWLFTIKTIGGRFGRKYAAITVSQFRLVFGLIFSCGGLLIYWTWNYVVQNYTVACGIGFFVSITLLIIYLTKQKLSNDELIEKFENTPNYIKFIYLMLINFPFVLALVFILLLIHKSYI